MQNTIRVEMEYTAPGGVWYGRWGKMAPPSDEKSNTLRQMGMVTEGEFQQRMGDEIIGTKDG